MSCGRSFNKIGSIEHQLICNEKNHIQELFVFEEPQGSLQIYVTTARQWISTESENVVLRKIQTLAQLIYSSDYNFNTLIDPAIRIPHDAESVVEELLNAYNLDPQETRNFKKDVSLIMDKCCRDVEEQNPREFNISIFIEILASQVCDKEEFEEQYSKLFKGPISGTALRMKLFVEEGDWREFLDGQEVILLPCSDMFHKRCIGEWVNQRNSKCFVCQWSSAKKI